MRPLEMILKNAARSQKTIVLSEGDDPRVIEAARMAREKDVARVVLIRRALLGDRPLDGIICHDPVTSGLTTELAQLYYNLRKHKGVTPDEANLQVQKPHVFAALMVKAGHADGCVGGAVLPSAEIIKTAIQIIGRAPDARLVSSFFLMLFCATHHEKKGAHVFADAGLVVDPTAQELSEIAMASARSFRELTGEVARIAMLSFSTHGSATHAAVSKVQQATNLVRAAQPDLLIDGELQFDAAFVPDVAQSKAADSPLGGNANVFVFPNLEAGNIGYKIAQRLGGAVAIGPILQGLDRPANDLSRGCSAEDILHIIAATAAQAQQVDEQVARQEEQTS